MSEGKITCKGNEALDTVSLCLHDDEGIKFSTIRLYTGGRFADAFDSYNDALKVGDEIVRRWDAVELREISEETEQENDSCLGEGWNWAYTPPDTDRLVQFAWDDGSTSENTLGFCNTISGISQQEGRGWWLKDGSMLRSDSVLAWREIVSEETKQENDSCLGEGWNWAYTPPDSDRLVQIAWDDGSTSDDTLGFYDSVSSIPPTEEKVWWNKDLCLLGDDAVLAWREIVSEATKQEKQNWIPVTDRPPPPEVSVLVSRHGGTTVSIDAKFENGKWINGEYANITHWMLPPDAPNKQAVPTSEETEQAKQEKPDLLALWETAFTAFMAAVVESRVTGDMTEGSLYVKRMCNDFSYIISDFKADKARRAAASARRCFVSNTGV